MSASATSSSARRSNRPGRGARAALLAGLMSCLGAVPAAVQEDVYLPAEEFLESVFEGPVPAPRLIWLKGERRERVRDIMGHPYPALRLRYWFDGEVSAWVLEEIGKTEPITTGLAVGPDGIRQVRVLVYRESRGGEVRHPFFTEQFVGAALDEGAALDRSIDGISGATLSVRALTRLSRMALYLHREVVQDETS